MSRIRDRVSTGFDNRDCGCVIERFTVPNGEYEWMKDFGVYRSYCEPHQIAHDEIMEALRGGKFDEEEDLNT